MSKLRMIFGAALIGVLPLLSACVPAVLVTGAAVGVMSAHDRRSTGVQADDEVAEWKGSNRMPAHFAESAHANFTAYNRILLITGEVRDEETQRAIGEMAAGIEGIKKLHNELLVAPISSYSSRSNDAFLTSKFKTRLLESNQLSANHIKPVSENGTLFLLGIVNEREAKVAVAIARTTDGVRKVVNLLELVPEADTRRLDNAVLGASRPPPNLAAPVEAR